MSARGEQQLVKLMLDEDALALISRQGLNLDVVPTPALRGVVEWSLRYHTQSREAPSRQALGERFGDLLSDSGVDLDAPAEDSVEWAIEDLVGSYTRSSGMRLLKEAARAVSDAAHEDKLGALEDYTARLAELVGSLQPKNSRVDMRSGAADMLATYDRVAGSEDKMRGMALGLPAVDAHTRGIWPGEIAIVIAPTKRGKSFLLANAALAEWRRGRVAGLWTLENSIEMTQLRLACLELHLSYSDLQDGTLAESEYKLLVEWVEDVLVKSDTPLHILHPDQVQRRPHAIVQQARGLGVESLILDQLTFVEPNESKRNQSRAYEVRDILHDLAATISTGRQPLSCLMAHQAKRDAVKEAERTGRLTIDSGADSAEVERTGAWVFGLWASEHQQALGQTTLQTLAVRRGKPRDFELAWDVGVGLIRDMSDALGGGL